MTELLVHLNNYLIVFTAIVMLIVSFTGIGHFCLMQRIGITISTGGMVWLAYLHHKVELIPCDPCLMVLFGIHIVSISVAAGWILSRFTNRYTHTFFYDK